MTTPLHKPNTQITVPYSGSQNAYYFVPPTTKSYTRLIAITGVLTSRPFKSISKKLHTLLIRTSLLVRLITRGRTARVTNTNTITSQEIKHLLRFIKTVQTQISKINKLLTKNTKTISIRKAGEIGTTFFRIIDVPLIRTIKTSKSLVKNIKSIFISSNRINKFKTTTIKVDSIQNSRVNKQKQWNPKVDNIQGIKLIKTKIATFRAVIVLINRLNKQKTTNIKSSNIFPIKFNKKASKGTTAAQVVSATITRASTRKRGVTSGITYTIGSTRTQTLHRQAVAVLVKAFRPNKSISKNIKASNINTLFLTRDNIAWKFILKVVTKITSFKAQTINKLGYAIPDPDPINPNMLDSSEPSVQGLIYGNPDDDSFIE